MSKLLLPVTYRILDDSKNVIAILTLHVDRCKLQSDLAYDQDSIQSDPLEYLRGQAIEDFENRTLEFAPCDEDIDRFNEFVELVLKEDFTAPPKQN
ncbi:hypothetical protein [Synechococcus elongatus]|uniref:hypothetical protein n=1 Tax=Synechococcus elongatus TaxID=32046 RepID=UPI000F7EBFFA|nr:hypothetical protein [Synechococcus elongatus]